MMARKNLLASVTSHDATKADHEARSDYANRGASRSMMLSIEEMAENTKKMIAGEAIVSLDPNLVDGSFVSDRIEEDEEEFALFRQGMKDEGQLQPILVRPHPDVDGRYMIVFGHRRTRAARELGVPVRAVVKNLEAIAHIIAQGQENSRRANLSFIEKALFAKKLLSMGQSKETIKSALSVDDTLLSRMLSVVESVPPTVIEAIGAAKSVGRDRWEELKKLLAHPKRADFAKELVFSDEFRSTESAGRFNYVLAQLKFVRKAARKATNRDAGAWTPADKMVAASYRNTGKTFSLSLKSKDAGEFGYYISSNLEALYSAFKDTKARNQGD
jgi:ParB family transcriptional regulator, chromosome partitioning protein